MFRSTISGCALGALLLLMGCPDTGEDNDFDGFNELVDCDDNDASVFPGHEELCDGKDNDCDGEIDEDIPEDEGTTAYPDADGDGFGDDAAAETFCGDVPDDYVEVGGDCDDSDPEIHPDAVEDCTDGIDNDCDGEVDEDVATASATATATATTPTPTSSRAPTSCATGSTTTATGTSTRASTTWTTTASPAAWTVTTKSRRSSPARTRSATTSTTTATA